VVTVAMIDSRAITESSMSRRAGGMAISEKVVPEPAA
jgi:hypothetical protein